MIRWLGKAVGIVHHFTGSLLPLKPSQTVALNLPRIRMTARRLPTRVQQLLIVADPNHGMKPTMQLHQIKLPAIVQLWVCLFMLALVAGCDPATTLDSPASPDSASEVVAGTVELRVDFTGEKKDLKVKVPCSAGSTVFAILQRAKNMGDLDFDSQGAGGTAFVHSIDGVMNAGRRGNNWVFRVNEQLAKESCGSLVVTPGDLIEWKFGKYEPNPEPAELK